MTVKCAYCQKDTDDLHRDHVVPRSRGGPDTASNIVMACADCNREKRDSLASEWLGDRCPVTILKIEAGVNRRLRDRFKKRNGRKHYKAAPAQLYAFQLEDNGSVSYSGVVVEERLDCIRIEAIDALLMVGCGLWQLSGSLYDIPRSRCRLFNDRDAMLEAMFSINQKLWPTK